eukprot:m.62167 g.62167  ORF g.62167 m.62167 type:complete len:61 (-) comp11490_c0_seq1:115-297(-)
MLHTVLIMSMCPQPDYATHSEQKEVFAPFSSLLIYFNVDMLWLQHSVFIVWLHCVLLFQS